MFLKLKLSTFLSNSVWSTHAVRNLRRSNILLYHKACGSQSSGLIIGLYMDDNDFHGAHIKFTATGQKVDDRNQGKISEILKKGAAPPPKIGQVRMIYGVDDEFPAIAVCGLGSECKGYNFKEGIDEKKESIRLGIGAAVRAFLGHALQFIYVDSCSHAESAAEGAALGVWIYQELRRQALQCTLPSLKLFDCCDFSGWRIGLEKAAAQNLARQLQETPRNLLSPSLFAHTVVHLLSKVGINVEIRKQSWAEFRNLNAFLAVSKGSCDPPVFLELLYEGCDPNVCPIVLIGKGCTFDAGGLCIKTCDEMKDMRGDMSGAACIIATMKAVSNLHLPINIRGLIPLCENVIGPSAYKPGDILFTVNGKSVFVEDTDAEGVLMLADAISYAKEYNPKFILDIGTFTPEMESGLGSSASGVFSNCESLYETMHIASIHTGDRIWRMPLWRYFTDYVRETKVSDLTNQKRPKKIGSPCKAASFLHEFIPDDTDWIHIDNYGVSRTSGNVYTYLRKGMSGRPTRTLIEFIAQLACQVTPQDSKSGCK